MSNREQLDELREMLINGDHPTKLHREQLLSLVNASLNDGKQNEGCQCDRCAGTRQMSESDKQILKSLLPAEEITEGTIRQSRGD